MQKYRQKLQESLAQGSLTGLEMTHQFTFECQDDCMGRCCNTINIMLDPWDVEIMARYLGTPGRDFLKEYCVYEVDRGFGWPFARFRQAEKGPCAFMLKDGKCKVYPARSRNCRTYPLGRAVRSKPSAEGGGPEEIFFMVEQQPFCFGHRGHRSWTVRDWLEDADAIKMYQLFDLYMEVINYCTGELNSKVWMSEAVAAMMAPMLFGPDMLRAKLNISPDQVSHEEFYRRRMKALQAVLTDLAGGFGFGPGAGGDKEDGSVKMMDTMKGILING
jgi:Fe-S-cluster containining protein